MRWLRVVERLALARAALSARKRAIVAGPGNSPVVVDETACLEHAAISLVTGAAYDNNLLCIAEKQVVCVARVVRPTPDRGRAHRRLRAEPIADRRPAPGTRSPGARTTRSSM